MQLKNVAHTVDSLSLAWVSDAKASKLKEEKINKDNLNICIHTHLAEHNRSTARNKAMCNEDA